MQIRYWFFMLLFIFSSCANYKLNYTKENKQWEENIPPQTDFEHRMYLIGDAGSAPLGETTNVLTYLKKELATAPTNSSVVFLGDNIYPGGMPPEEGNQTDRQLATHRLQTQLDALKQFKGRPFFIPGNHDWKDWGLQGLKRQEDFIEEYMNQGVEEEEWQNYFLPDNGCAGPEIVELNPNLVLLIIDSQWWLTDWDREPTINSGCAVKSRRMMTFWVENALRKHRKKNVIVAMHHPMFTNGPHGGNYDLKDHIFPLTQFNPNLYIPLPGIGSAAAFMRGTVGTKQDVANRNFQTLKNSLLTSAVKNGNFIFVSGHEHNLQYLENNQQTFIVSGAGSKKSPSKIGKGAKFTYGAKGYSTIDFYKDGQSWVQFWEPNEEGTEAKVVFRKKLREKIMTTEEDIPTSFPIFEKGLDSIEMAVAKTKAGDIGFLHKAFLGSHHREVYQQTYKFPILDLGDFQGGVKPVKRGGGGQTNSLRLEAKSGKQYVMRAMTKDVSRTLPFPFNKMSAAKYIAEDNFLATHPFAPTAIPYLADAAMVYHTNPKLYYIPKQPDLGIYNDDYGGDVYLVEERPSGNWENTGTFGDSKKIISTPDVTEKVLKNHKHFIDQEWALRSRLFDVILGDWDRHDDQWRWAKFEEEGGHHKLYRPIPRDRDQAFSDYDGFAIKFARLFMPFLRQLRVYGPTIHNMKWIAWSSRHFDYSFLNELSWEEWQTQVQFLQDNLTDEIIESAFEHWPTNVQELTADHIIKTIKARRDNLPNLATRYFNRLAKEVDVYGTDEKELFDIERLPNGDVQVQVWQLNKHDDKKHLFYERTFDHEITKEIHVYGIGDNDEFQVKGEVDKSILIRLIGGQGEDVFKDESTVKKGQKKTLVYDDLSPNILALGVEGKDKRSHHRDLNMYDRKHAHYEHNFFYALPILGVNPDDGFLLGANAIWTTYSFKKMPYAALHQFNTTYAFDTKAWSLNYTGDYLNAFNHWDFYVESKLNSPTFSANFYGFGNETRINNNIDYYRTRQSQIHLFPALKRRFANGAGNVKIGPLFELRNLEATSDRFLVTEFQEDITSDFYQNKSYLGARLGFEFINLDNFVIPTKGIHFTTTLDYLGGLNKEDSNFGRLRSSFTFVQSLDRKEKLVFASKIGVGTNIGNGYQFYHAPNLGGRQSLRGYRAERFYGKTTFWQNIDLRAKLLSSYNETLPFTFGIYGGFDYGRAWEPNEISKQWHYNYGGGFWIAPVDVLTFTFGAFQPREAHEGSARFVFQLGLGF